MDRRQLEALSRTLWDDPNEVITQEDRFLEFQTKALGAWGDAMSFYYDEKEGYYTDDGVTVDDIAAMHEISDSDSPRAQALYKLCDKEAQHYYCNVNKDGELIFKSKNGRVQTEAMILLIQAATAITAVSASSKEWQKEIAKVDKEPNHVA